MKERENIKTTIHEAVSYWRRYISESDLSVDWIEADTHCWRCGCKKGLQRCHIVPDALGGKDEPANIVLLCGRCHADGPNVDDPEIMWDWIKAYKVSFYETFWDIQGMKEYEFIYGQSVLEEIRYILKEADLINEIDAIQETINQEIAVVVKNASVHFGQPYFNTATMAGMYRMMLKNMANKYNVLLQHTRKE